MRNWAKLAVFLLCGFSIFGRSFAYLGVRAANLYIGDVALAVFLLFTGGAVVRMWMHGLLHPTPLSGFFWCLIFFQFYGVMEAIRGLVLGYEPLIALQILVFNVYPLYFFLGLWTGLAYPDLLRKLIRVMTIVSCVLGLAYFTFRPILDSVKVPGTNSSLFQDAASGGGWALIGLTYLGPDLRPWLIPIVISLFLVLAQAIRAEWLSLIVVLTLQSILIGKVKRLFFLFGAVALLLVVGLITDVSLPSPEGRGGTVSSRDLIGRAVSSFDENAAREYSTNASTYAGTISWRKKWWDAIWNSVNVDKTTAILGHGYGYPLHDLVPYLRNSDLRTPHNIFFFTLGYSGWIGVFVFFSMQIALGYTFYRAWVLTGQPYGLVMWASSIVGAFFGQIFETPFGAIPFYLLAGMSCSELFVLVETPKPSPVPLSERFAVNLPRGISTGYEIS